MQEATTCWLKVATNWTHKREHFATKLWPKVAARLSQSKWPKVAASFTRKSRRLRDNGANKVCQNAATMCVAMYVMLTYANVR